MTGNVCFRDCRPCNRICPGAISPADYAAFQAGQEWQRQQRPAPGLGSVIFVFGDEDGMVVVGVEHGIFAGFAQTQQEILPEQAFTGILVLDLLLGLFLPAFTVPPEVVIIDAVRRGEGVYHAA